MSNSFQKKPLTMNEIKWSINQTLSMTSHSSNQTGFSSSKHSYKGKEFCSSGCAKDWYRKR